MRKLFLAVVLLPFFCNLSQAKVYKCIDQFGNEVYNSDGGPNCTLLYGKEAEEAVAPEGVQGAGAPSTQDRKVSKPDGISLTFVERKNEVRDNNLYAWGTVKNNGSNLLRAVRISVECYDGQDQLVATESSYAQPQDMLPGETAGYEVVTKHDPRIEKIKTTAHWAEREE
jgi:hypothetical protein